MSTHLGHMGRDKERQAYLRLIHFTEMYPSKAFVEGSWKYMMKQEHGSTGSPCRIFIAGQIYIASQF